MGCIQEGTKSRSIYEPNIGVHFHRQEEATSGIASNGRVVTAWVAGGLHMPYGRGVQHADVRHFLARGHLFVKQPPCWLVDQVEPAVAQWQPGRDASSYRTWHVEHMSARGWRANTNRVHQEGYGHMAWWAMEGLFSSVMVWCSIMCTLPSKKNILDDEGIMYSPARFGVSTKNCLVYSSVLCAPS